MEHRRAGYNAGTALVAALLVGALLAAPAAGKGSKHKLKGKEEKYSEITFYLNTTIGFNTFFLELPLGGLPTQQPPPKTYTFFGAASVLDAFVTSGPDPASPALGSVKGFFVFDNNNDNGPGLELVATAIFNDASGFGAGSTVSYRGFSQQYLPVRELAIVGGTGRFRLARGWVDVSTVGVGGFGFNLLFVSHVFYYDLEDW